MDTQKNELKMTDEKMKTEGVDDLKDARDEKKETIKSIIYFIIFILILES